MLELWEIRSTRSLPSLPGLLWPGVVAPEKGQIELNLGFECTVFFKFKLSVYAK